MGEAAHRGGESGQSDHKSDSRRISELRATVRPSDRERSRTYGMAGIWRSVRHESGLKRATRRANPHVTGGVVAAVRSARHCS